MNTSKSMFNKRLLYALVLFVLIVTLIIVSKPCYIFDKHGYPIPFGTGEGKTILSLGVLVILVAYLSFFTINIIDIVCKK